MRNRSSFVGTLIWNSANEFFEPLISLLRAPIVRIITHNIPHIVLVFAIGNLTLHTPEMVYRTDVGETKRVGLPDGSTVVLNTDALLRVQSSSEQLTVQLLRGEALFSVLPRLALPFLVRAGNAEVVTRGAVFAVYLKSSESVEILVSEGSAKVESPVHLLLRAGEIAETSASSATSRLLPASDLRRKLSWEKGYLEFSGAPLSEVVADLNRYNKLRVLIDDPSVAQRRISGVFRATDSEGFCTVVSQIFGVRVNVVETESGTEIHLSGPVS
jgi:transmembrane sensor